MNARHFLIPFAAAALPLAAGAADLHPGGVFVEGGVAKHQAYSVTAGVLWPWSWRREFGSTQASGLTEAFVSNWSGLDTGGRRGFTQVGLVPLVRLRFDSGRSPWFIEGGIGVSLMDRLYRTQTKEFSTKFNFVDVAGVGRSFGADGRRELSLRISHISNAGIKEPNPGENFLQLRYAVKF
ncbi:MAG TPA: acyloxyacyl hydrolase [Ramlibacter sp.]|nr:acyloxyacyl hydrolase [Ramlibacter sp.]